MKIKVGDIFYSNGSERYPARFYQVLKVYESGRVRIREIEKKEIKQVSVYDMLAIPVVNSFKEDSKETLKVVSYDGDNDPYLFFSSYAIAKLYKGEPVISSYYFYSY